MQKVLNGQNLEYIITFPLPNPLPKLTQILYNGNEICSGPPETPSYNTVVTTINLEHVFKTEPLGGYYGQQANQPANHPVVQKPEYVAPLKPPVAQQPQYVPQQPQPQYVSSPRPTPPRTPRPRPTPPHSSSLDDLLYDRYEISYL